MDKSKWEYKKLGEVATFLNGYAFKPSEWSSEGFPIIRIQNLTNTNAEYNYFNGDNIDKRYIVNNGDLLVSWSATLGAFIWDGDKALLNQHIFKTIFDKTDIDKHFLRYSIISSLNLMSTKAHGITMRHITKKDFDNIKIRVPSLSAQHRIVSELDQLSAIISLKQQQMKEYDALAQSLFYEMFGDPTDNAKCWNVVNLKDVSKEKLTYGSGASATSFDGEVRYIRITDITNDGSLVESKVSPNKQEEKYLLHDGDILFARSGATVGKTYLYSQKDGKAIYAGYLIRLIPNKEIVLPLYVFYYTKTRYYLNFISKAQRAVAQPNINAKQYGDLKIPLPPLSLQRSFAEKVKAIEHQKSLLKQSITETQTLLDSRMQEYFG